jgi:hypothetical protein
LRAELPELIRLLTGSRPRTAGGREQCPEACAALDRLQHRVRERLHPFGVAEGTREVDMSKKGGNKAKTAPKPPMANKGPKKK